MQWRSARGFGRAVVALRASDRRRAAISWRARTVPDAYAAWAPWRRVWGEGDARGHAEFWESELVAWETAGGRNWGRRSVGTGWPSGWVPVVQALLALTVPASAEDCDLLVAPLAAVLPELRTCRHGCLRSRLRRDATALTRVMGRVAVASAGDLRRAAADFRECLDVIVPRREQ